MGRQKPRGFPAAGHYVMCLPCLATVRQVDGHGPGPASTCPVCCLVGLPRATGLSGNVGHLSVPSASPQAQPSSGPPGKNLVVFPSGPRLGSMCPGLPGDSIQVHPLLTRLGGPTGEMGLCSHVCPHSSRRKLCLVRVRLELAPGLLSGRLLIKSLRSRQCLTWPRQHGPIT